MNVKIGQRVYTARIVTKAVSMVKKETTAEVLTWRVVSVDDGHCMVVMPNVDDGEPCSSLVILNTRTTPVFPVQCEAVERAEQLLKSSEVKKF